PWMASAHAKGSGRRRLSRSGPAGSASLRRAEADRLAATVRHFHMQDCRGGDALLLDGGVSRIDVRVRRVGIDLGDEIAAAEEFQWDVQLIGLPPRDAADEPLAAASAGHRDEVAGLAVDDPRLVPDRRDGLDKRELLLSL